MARVSLQESECSVSFLRRVQMASETELGSLSGSMHRSSSAPATHAVSGFAGTHRLQLANSLPHQVQFVKKLINFLERHPVRSEGRVAGES